MDTRNHVSISLPKTLIQKIRQAIKQHPDYSSIAEFVKDAVRRRLEELGCYDDEIIDANNCDAEVLER